MKLYFNLFHGRKDPDEDLETWGFNGPTFEVTGLQGTYTSSIKLNLVGGHSEMLWYKDDLVYYDGCYYGDWSLTTTPLTKPQQFNRSLSLVD